MGTAAIILLAMIALGYFCYWVNTMDSEEISKEKAIKSLKKDRSNRYTKSWKKIENMITNEKALKGGMKPGTINVIAGSHSGKSYMGVWNIQAAYQKGIGDGYDTGYQDGIDHAIKELCEVDGESNG